MSLKNKKLVELLKKLIRKELKELSATGGIDGGEGPPKHLMLLEILKTKIKMKMT